MIAATQVSNFWVPLTWPEAGVKFVALLVAFDGTLWFMRSETIKSRIKDGNEHVR